MQGNGATKPRFTQQDIERAKELNTLKMPPSALDAEMSVLGSMLLSLPAIDEARDMVQEADFYLDANQRIFRAILYLRDKNKPADAETVAEVLTKRKEIEEVGGIGRLLEILDHVPHAAHVRFYADTVKERAERRKIIQWAAGAIKDAHDLSNEPAEITQELEEKLFSVRENAASANDVKSMTDILIDAMSRIGAAQKEGIPTGIKKLDEMLLGFHPCNLIVLGARPSVGKSAFALNVAMHVGRLGMASALFSLESSKMEVAERQIAMYTGIDSNRLKSGDLGTIEHEQILHSAEEIRKMPIWIDDSESVTIGQIASKARFLKRRQDIKLVIIDYLQLIEPEDRKGVNREQQVATISRRAKNMAKQLNVPVLMLAQLARETEKNPGRRPAIWNLRESGAIEQDANVVLLLHRLTDEDQSEMEEKYRMPTNRATLIVAKNRDGKKANIDLDFAESTMRFTEHDDWLDPSQAFEPKISGEEF